MQPLYGSAQANIRDLQTIVATAIPKITDEFKGLDLVSWYGSAFFMTVGGFQSTCKLQTNPKLPSSPVINNH